MCFIKIWKSIEITLVGQVHVPSLVNGNGSGNMTLHKLLMLQRCKYFIRPQSYKQRIFNSGTPLQRPEMSH